MKIAKDESSIAYTLSYQDIEGSVTQAHTHLGQQHTTRNIVVWLCSSNPPTPPAHDHPGPPACPASPGTVSGVLTAADVLSFPAQGVGPGDLAAVIEAIRKGVAYGNVHTSRAPAPSADSSAGSTRPPASRGRST